MAFSWLAPAQALKPLAARIAEAQASGSPFEAYDLFAVSTAPVENLAASFDNPAGVSVLALDRDAVQRLLSAAPLYFRLTLPSPAGPVDLDLYRADILTADFRLETATSGGLAVAYEGGLHYRGIVAGDIHSLAAISVFRDAVMGLVSDAGGNRILGPVEDRADGIHVLYADKNLNQQPGFACQTPGDITPYPVKDLQPPGAPLAVNCIRMYWEVNLDIYQNKGSVTNATNYVTGIFNQSATIYANDNIPVELSEVFVWNVTSPYTSSTTGGLLSQFQSFRNSFNGDLGSLLGFAGGGGVAAGFNGLCASNLDNSQCYSGISSSYNNFPTYSWSVLVVTHEQGHLLGSRHTHACVWNGNNTAIDNCGPTAGYGYEGSCSGAPTPVGGGTVMSYCHLVGGVGINFTNGFGTQPRNVILNKYNAASCLSACGTTGCGTPNGLTAVNIGLASADLTWGAVSGATTYALAHRAVGAPSWTTVPGLTATTYPLGGLTSGTWYEFQVQADCSGGLSSWSAVAQFITATPPCALVAAQSTGNVTMNSATLGWDTVPGALGYNIQYFETGTQNFVPVNNVSGSSYELTGLLPATGYTWYIQTLCNGSYSSYFGPATFTTGDCMPPASHWAPSVNATSATVKWSKIDGALYYEVRYREWGATTWLVKKTAGNYGTKTINGLQPNTTYQWKVRTRCSANPRIWSAWTGKKQFSTPSLQPANRETAVASDETPALSVHPNPAGERVTLDGAVLLDGGVLTVMNRTGQAVRTVTWPGGWSRSLTLNIADLPAGLYAIALRQDGRVTHARFMVGR